MFEFHKDDDKFTDFTLNTSNGKYKCEYLEGTRYFVHVDENYRYNNVDYGHLYPPRISNLELYNKMKCHCSNESWMEF